MRKPENNIKIHLKAPWRFCKTERAILHVKPPREFWKVGWYVCYLPWVLKLMKFVEKSLEFLQWIWLALLSYILGKVILLNILYYVLYKQLCFFFKLLLNLNSENKLYGLGIPCLQLGQTSFNTLHIIPDNFSKCTWGFCVQDGSHSPKKPSRGPSNTFKCCFLASSYFYKPKAL